MHNGKWLVPKWMGSFFWLACVFLCTQNGAMLVAQVPPKLGDERERTGNEQPKARTEESLVYSGPQIGESLPGFVFREVLGSAAGKEYDFVTEAKDQTILLLFVHDVNRQSISFVRTLSKYAFSRQQDGLRTAVVFLDSDISNAEATVKRIEHALTPGIATGVSVDGREGPGSYGLNRKVMLTILVSHEGKVFGNFALIQPSLQSDLPKVFKCIVERIGGTAPAALDDASTSAMMQRRENSREVPNLRPYLAPVIRLNALESDVVQAATAIEELARNDESIRSELIRIARTIVDSGKLESYGTPKAREYLKKWGGEWEMKSPSEGEPASDEKPKKDPSQ